MLSKDQPKFVDDLSVSNESYVSFYCPKLEKYESDQDYESRNDQDQDYESRNDKDSQDYIDTNHVNEQYSKLETKEKKKVFSGNSKLIKKNPQKRQKVVYILPGETKNIPKNFKRAFTQFIESNFQPDERTQSMKKLVDLKAEKVNKQTFTNLLKDNQLRQLANQFFGQLKWAPIFLTENRVQLEPYIRLNKLYFRNREHEQDQELSTELSDI